MRKALFGLMDHPWWRLLEGVHTLVWIIGGAVSISIFLLGWFQQIQLFWLISIPIVLLAAVVYLGERLYWQFGYCPLSTAATKVYTELKDSTGVGAFAKGYGSKAEHVLDEVATAIAQEIPIFGRQPPATSFDLVPEKALTQGGIVDGGNKYRRYNVSTFDYVDLSVRRSDVRKATRAIRKNWKALDKKTS